MLFFSVQLNHMHLGECSTTRPYPCFYLFALCFAQAGFELTLWPRQALVCDLTSASRVAGTVGMCYHVQLCAFLYWLYVAFLKEGLCWSEISLNIHLVFARSPCIIAQLTVMSCSSCHGSCGNRHAQTMADCNTLNRLSYIPLRHALVFSVSGCLWGGGVSPPFSWL